MQENRRLKEGQAERGGPKDQKGPKGPREGKAEKTNRGDRAAGQAERGGQRTKKDPKDQGEARPRKPTAGEGPLAIPKGGQSTKKDPKDQGKQVGAWRAVRGAWGNQYIYIKTNGFYRVLMMYIICIELSVIYQLYWPYYCSFLNWITIRELYGAAWHLALLGISSGLTVAKVHGVA